MKFPRASGILLHPTSLPGPYGIGDLGPDAFRFVDKLVAARQTYWQILPLGPTGYGDSPYSGYSAFAGNTLLISPEKLFEANLLEKSSLEGGSAFPSDRVDFSAVFQWKVEMLREALDRFVEMKPPEMLARYEAFQQTNGWWLEDYAAFRAIKAANGQKPWYEWPEAVKSRDRGALAAERKGLTDAIKTEKFAQFLFFEQWAELKTYAAVNGVRIIGDVPIFLALDSADVWCNQSKFKLNDDGSPKVVSGVPPDYFSKTGQLWGNPIYDWDAMRSDGFGWWIARIASALKMVDVVRIDHFRGFAAAWEVPAEDNTAENGQWVKAPGREFFTALRNALGDVPMIAEDLGVITPDVDALRDEFGLPGMHILQYAFGGDANNRDLPHNYIQNCVAYTGTHDNDTTIGWWRSLPGGRRTKGKKSDSRERDLCLKYLNSTGKEINWDLIRAAWASVADTAIAPFQDLLGLGSEARMNLPASTDGNWFWRFQEGDISEGAIGRLRELTEVYGRTTHR